MALAAHLFGSAAQEQAGAELLRQGHPTDLLVKGRVNFRERGVDLALPVGIGVLIGVLATLNLTGSELGRTGSRIFHPILLVAGGAITAGQVFAVRFVRSSFRKSGDEALMGVDVQALMDAATRAFPSWFRPLVAARFALVTVGSVLILILLALPGATDHFG